MCKHCDKKSKVETVKITRTTATPIEMTTGEREIIKLSIRLKSGLSIT